MAKGVVGIVAKGNRGECLALFFAQNDFTVKVCQLDQDRNRERLEGEKPHINVKNIRGDIVKKKIRSLPIHWLERIDELAGCDLLIEAVWDELTVKQHILKELETVSEQEVPILSETFLFLPSELSSVLKDPANFTVAYFYDIEYLVHIVEFVIHDKLPPANSRRVMEMLKSAGFAPYALNESAGFIYNRLGCLGILNLFRLYDREVLSFENLGKYLFATKSGAAAVNINLAVEIRNDLFDFVPLFKVLNEKFGPRFYLPRFLSYRLTRENFGSTIAAYSTTYSVAPGAEDDPLPIGGDTIESVYIIGNELIHNNILHPMLRKKINIYMDARDNRYFGQLQKYDQRLYTQLLTEARVLTEEEAPKIDLVIDFTLESAADKVARVRGIQDKFGPRVPVVLNTPIYKIESIAGAAVYPAMVFGIYTQKNYLLNTEIVITPHMDERVYLGLRDFIRHLTTAYIETRDADVRPLILMLIPKMLEAVRILEEGTAGMETIEALAVDRPVFREMDLFGLDKIAFICEYLAPLYPDLFDIPDRLRRLIEENRLGYSTGSGFHPYDQQ